MRKYIGLLQKETNKIKKLVIAKYMMGYGTIKRKLIVSFLLLFFIPTMILSFIPFLILLDTNKQKTNSNNKIALMAIRSSIEQVLRDAEIATNTIMFDIDVINILDNPGNEVDKYFNTLIINKKISTVLKSNLYSYGDSMIAIFNKRSVFTSLSTIQDSDYYNKILTQEVAGQKKNYSIWADNIYKLRLTGNIEERFVLFLKAFVDYRRGDVIGSIMIGVPRRHFDKILENIEMLKGTNAYIVYKNGQIIASTYDVAGEKIFMLPEGIKNANDNKSFISIENPREKTILNVQQLSVPGWKLIQVIPASFFNKDIIYTRNLLLVINAIFSLVFISISYLIANSISKPIHFISMMSKEIAMGNFGARVDVRGNIELKQLAGNFNSMAEEMQDLLKKVKEIERMKREYELQALYAQINPHFLFNTLNSLKVIADASRIYNVSKFIAALGNLLQSSIINKNEFITVVEEVENTKNYILIQKLRFINSFEDEYDIADDIINCMTLKLILQPVIENSILHGFEGITYRGKIKLRGFLEGGFIVFEIEDNGIGLDAEVKDNLMLKLNKKPEKFNGIGMPNVYQRLKLHYGEEATMTIQNSPDKGTKIRIKFPKEGTEPNEL